MRKIVAISLLAISLSISTPLMARERGDRGGRDDGRDINPIVRIIKQIIRHLLPAPTDDSGNILPPKP